MPMRSLYAVLTGHAHEARWRVALVQAGIAGGVLVALWLTGLALGWIITMAVPHAAVLNGTGAAPEHVRNVVRTSALMLSLGTLAAVLLFVQVLRLALPIRPTAQGAGSEPRRSARPAA